MMTAQQQQQQQDDRRRRHRPRSAGPASSLTTGGRDDHEGSSEQSTEFGRPGGEWHGWGISAAELGCAPVHENECAPWCEEFPGSSSFSSLGLASTRRSFFVSGGNITVPPPATLQASNHHVPDVGEGGDIPTEDTLTAWLSALCTLYGGVTFLLGLWQLLEVDTARQLGIPDGHVRDLLFAVAGILGLAILDEFYAEGGAGGHMWWTEEGKLCGRWEIDIAPFSLVGKLLYLLTTILTFISSTLLWIGLTDLIGDFVPGEWLYCWWVDVLMILVGYLLLMMTGSLHFASGVAQQQQKEAYFGSPLRLHAWAFVNSLTGIAAQVLLWEGTFCLYWIVCLDGSHCEDRSSDWWKDLFLMAVGHMLLNFTERFFHDDDKFDVKQGAKPLLPQVQVAEGYAWRIKNIEVLGRSALAIMAGALHNLGLWYILSLQIARGWQECNSPPSAGDGGVDPRGGLSSNHIPCWARNMGFILIGFAMQPGLWGPLLREPVAEAIPVLEPKVQPEIATRVVTRRRAGSATMRVRLISTVPVPNSRRKQEVSAFLRQRKDFIRRNQVLGHAQDRTQSETVSPGDATILRKHLRKRGSLKDKLLSPTSSNSSSVRSHLSPKTTDYLLHSHSGSELDLSVETAGPESLTASLARPILAPEPEPEHEQKDLEVLSLPTPRTLRLLGSELFFKTHFPEHLQTRTFGVGERVQADWNAFGNWYPGVVVASEIRNGTSLFTIKYDDDSVEKDVPPQLIRPARAQPVKTEQKWVELSDEARERWGVLVGLKLHGAGESLHRQQKRCNGTSSPQPIGMLRLSSATPKVLGKITSTIITVIGVSKRYF